MEDGTSPEGRGGRLYEERGRGGGTQGALEGGRYRGDPREEVELLGAERGESSAIRDSYTEKRRRKNTGWYTKQ